METLSESPRIYRIAEFLSDEECDEIIAKAAPRLAPSTVLAPKGNTKDSRRSSRGTFFPRSIDFLQDIERRIEEVTSISVDHGEGMQVLHYLVGGEYQPHHDYFSPATQSGKNALKRGGQRVVSFLLYLNDTPEGGETIFPEAKISVVPKKGDAIFFYNVDEEGRVDPKSLHGGAPVKKGEKWLATKWLREKPFR